MNYNNYKYIFPPRPENSTKISEVKFYQNLGYFAQPKLNGSCCLVFTNGDTVIIKNRHNQSFSNFKIQGEVLDLVKKLYIKEKDLGWIVLVGEYLNKSQKDENNKIFNQKLVFFDLIVYNSKHLLGETFENRYNLLLSLFKSKDKSDKFHFERFYLNDYNKWLYTINETFYIVKSFLNEDFMELYNELTKHEIYEGLVLKRRNAKLENGITEKNNTKTQIKIRKPTKNYQF
jgi:hypothetical protein